MGVTPTRSLWPRLVAVLFVASAAGALVAATHHIVETLADPSYNLARYPRDLPPSGNIFLRNAYRWPFLGAVFQVVLAPLYFIGGLLLFWYRDSGRRVVVWACGLQIGLQGLLALLGVYAIAASLLDPQVYPPLMGWVVLLATVAWGLLWFGLLTFFRSNTARMACGAAPVAQAEK